MEDVFHLGIKALIRNSSGQILLLKVNKDIDPTFQGTWDLPGGQIWKNSTIEETLKRKIKKEVGFSKIKKIYPFLLFLNKIRIPKNTESAGLILGTYVCDVDITKIKLSREFSDAKWCTFEEISELLKENYPIEFTEKIKSLSV